MKELFRDVSGRSGYSCRDYDVGDRGRYTYEKETSNAKETSIRDQVEREGGRARPAEAGRLNSEAQSKASSPEETQVIIDLDEEVLNKEGRGLRWAL